MSPIRPAFGHFLDPGFGTVLTVEYLRTGLVIIMGHHGDEHPDNAALSVGIPGHGQLELLVKGWFGHRLLPIGYRLRQIMDRDKI